MNDNIFYFFYNLSHKSEFFDRLIVFTADVFPYIVVVFAIIFLFKHHEKNPPDRMTPVIRARWKEILFVFFSSGIAWVVAKLLKILIHTNRPFLVLPDVQALFIEIGYAFPSLHATFFGALAISIFFSHKKTGYLFIFFALLIGLARIVAGVHFSIDILGGFVLGSLIAFIFYKIFK